MDTQATPTGKRKFVRHVIRGEGKLEPLNDHYNLGSVHHVMLQDIGRTGAMFETDQPIELNSTWRLRILHRGYQVAAIPVVIRYCRSSGAGYLVGGLFTVEPFIMSYLGVPEHDLNMDEWSLR